MGFGKITELLSIKNKMSIFSLTTLMGIKQIKCLINLNIICAYLVYVTMVPRVVDTTMNYGTSQVQHTCACKYNAHVT